MTAPAATGAGSGPASAAARDLPVRKPTRWVSSAPEILKRACLRCGNEGLGSGGPRLHEHAVLQGRDSSGSNSTAAATVYPPALCAAILRGIAAQHSREGRCLPAPLQRKLDRGRGVFDLQKDSRPEELDLQKLVLEAAEEANMNTDLEMDDAPFIDEMDFGAFVGSGSEGLS
eukprot:13294228-Alexandrium_andersonii.AAC.1